MLKKVLKNLSAVFSILCFALIGAGIGILIGYYDIFYLSDGGLVFTLVSFYLMLYLAFIFNIIIHEAGHWVGGLLSGYEFVSFRIFSFIIVKQVDRIVFRRFSIAGTGGQCLMAPKETPTQDFPVFLYNLGGPLANGLLSLACLAIYLILDPSWWRNAVLISGVLAIYFALGNGIPIKTKLVNNDGMNALTLWRDPISRQAFGKILRINQASMNGLRLRAMPASWFELDEASDMTNPHVVSMKVNQAQRLIDQGEYAAGQAAMQALLAERDLMGIYRTLLELELVCFDMLEKGPSADLSCLEQPQTKQVMKSMKNFPSILRFNYAKAVLVDQDEQAAARFRDRFAKVAKTYPSQAEIESEQVLWHLCASKSNPGLVEPS